MALQFHPFNVALPAGVVSTSSARKCRVALREGAGGPVRKEVVVPLSERPVGPRIHLFPFPHPSYLNITHKVRKLTMLMGKEAFKDHKVVHL